MNNFLVQHFYKTCFIIVQILLITGKTKARPQTQILNSRKLLVAEQSQQQQQSVQVFLALTLKSIDCNSFSFHFENTPTQIWDQFLNCELCAETFLMAACDPHPSIVYRFSDENVEVAQLKRFVNTIYQNKNCVEKQFHEYGEVEVSLNLDSLDDILIPDDSFDPQNDTLLEPCDFGSKIQFKRMEFQERYFDEFDNQMMTQDANNQVEIPSEGLDGEISGRALQLSAELLPIAPVVESNNEVLNEANQYEHNSIFLASGTQFIEIEEDDDDDDDNEFFIEIEEEDEDEDYNEGDGDDDDDDDDDAAVPFSYGNPQFKNNSAEKLLQSDVMEILYLKNELKAQQTSNPKISSAPITNQNIKDEKVQFEAQFVPLPEDESFIDQLTDIDFLEDTYLGKNEQYNFNPSIKNFNTKNKKLEKQFGELPEDEIDEVQFIEYFPSPTNEKFNNPIVDFQIANQQYSNFNLNKTNLFVPNVEDEEIDLLEPQFKNQINPIFNSNKKFKNKDQNNILEDDDKESDLQEPNFKSQYIPSKENLPDLNPEQKFSNVHTEKQFLNPFIENEFIPSPETNFVDDLEEDSIKGLKNREKQFLNPFIENEFGPSPETNFVNDLEIDSVKSQKNTENQFLNPFIENEFIPSPETNSVDDLEEASVKGLKNSNIYEEISSNNLQKQEVIEIVLQIRKNHDSNIQIIDQSITPQQENKNKDENDSAEIKFNGGGKSPVSESNQNIKIKRGQIEGQPQNNYNGGGEDNNSVSEEEEEEDKEVTRWVTQMWVSIAAAIIMVSFGAALTIAVIRRIRISFLNP